MALKPFTSKILADVGISMGDEGKGRLIYELIQELKEQEGIETPIATVLKVNGGANSGHTAGGIKLNLLPSGITDPSIQHFAIGSGVVADPRKLHWEIKPLEARGYAVISRLIIDERTKMSDLTHRLLDLGWEYYREHELKELPRGTTGRGISPAYADEVLQFPIPFSIFKGSKDAFAHKINERIKRSLHTLEYVCKVSPEAWETFFETLTHAEQKAHKVAIEEAIFPAESFDFSAFMGHEPFSLNSELLIETYWKAGSLLLDNIGDVPELILGNLNNAQYVIGEFGQSFWLDKRHGFSPNVSASHTYTPEFFQSACIPVQPIHTLGCCKAYDTKIGTHAFLTEMPLEHPLAQKLRKLEFGTSTGRQRMVGWFDAVEKGDALRYGGFEDIIINKLDALSYDQEAGWIGGELLICTAYRKPDGSLCHRVLRDATEQANLTPVYQQLPGWAEDISEVRHFEALPENAKRYIATLLQSILTVATRNGHKLTPPNIRYIGVGPEPGQIIKDVPSSKVLLQKYTVPQAIGNHP